MKVGILTFHYVPNYGAVFQALGMQKILEDLGHTPIFIDYVPEYMRGRYSALKGWGFNSGAQAFSKFRYRINECVRRRKFTTFREKRLKRSPSLRDRKELVDFSETLDAIVVGSDQVWNLSWQKRFDDTYFLGFLPKGSRVRKIAYGACFGHPEHSSGMPQALRCIEGFDFIGMRNEFGAAMIRSGCTRGPRVARIVDPAFFNDFPRIGENGDHVMLYSISNATRDICSNVSLEAGRYLSQKVVQVASESHVEFRDSRIEKVRRGGPEVWMDHIQRAGFVCSESFHGVVGAMLAGIPFVCASAGLRSHRLSDLVETYGLQNRMISRSVEFGEIQGLCSADPSYRSRLDEDIEASRKFLASALS